MTYVALDIGCMECGERSGLIGFYTTRTGAESAVRDARDRQSLDWQGQHEFLILDTRDVDSYSKYSEQRWTP